MMQKDLGPTRPQTEPQVGAGPKKGTAEIVRKAKEGQDLRVTRSSR